ncbi:malonate decarboxylase holo-ACP synthase [Pseudoduganella flava]|nr:malonate decarboxylase holo-ACP synthase [Pseudoduganella flava]
MAPRPHDLLFLHALERFEPAGAWPAWLDAAWHARAPLVVRREAVADGRVPAGARGRTRSERCKGYVQAASVARIVTPEMLARQAGTGDPAMPALQVLAALAPRLDELGVAWGPAGGAGFQLACGLPVLRADSDLDLLVRSPAPLATATLEQLLRMQADAAVRVDIQVDTGTGGFALADYARGGRVLVKTAHGPVLVSDPWHQAVAA